MHVDRGSLEIEAGGFQLPAILWVPQAIRGLVVALAPDSLDHLVAHDRHLFERLCAHGFALLAVGLLTPDEEASAELSASRRFDVDALASRTIKAIDSLAAGGTAAPVGLLTRGTSVAAALLVARRRGVGAIVSLSGRPDLAATGLPRVQTPTLFVVGDDDVPSLHFSQLAVDRMTCLREIRMVPGNGSLASLPAAEAAAREAVRWFERSLVTQHATGTQPARRLMACHGVESRSNTLRDAEEV